MKRSVRVSSAAYLAALAAVAGCGVSADPEAASTTGEQKQALTNDDNAGDDKAPVREPGKRVANQFELERMQKYLENRIDRTAVRKSLKGLDGRGVDCIDIKRQPALLNPDMKEVDLELAPRSLPPDTKDAFEPAKPAEMEPLFEIDPSGAQKLGTCDAGTVPIRDVLLDDLVRFATLDDYFAKIPSHLKTPIQRLPKLDLEPPAHDGPTSLHQYAHAYKNVTNWGAWAHINVWKPYTELNSEFSLGQIWVVGGSGSELQTLEVGSQKYRDLYGDGNAHLFIYSTRDNYGSTGCYNNSCGDFVQVSSSIYPGASIGPTSTYNGAQYEISVHWFKDMDSGSWWLNCQGQWVGYYPRNSYSLSGVRLHAAEIDFGGEIIDKQTGGLHTSTDMGSGQFPSAWWQKSAFMRLLRYNFTTTPSPATVWYTDTPSLTESRSDAACYDIDYHMGDPGWHSYFFYGGPGFHSVNCR